MANIKITVDGPLMDGHKITFKAPCDCVSVEKLKVCYVENATQKSRLFTMVDSHGNDLTGLGNLFYKDAYVNVVLDTNKGLAYLQNAGTNSYLENMLRASDGTPFRFGVTENGEYGYIVTDEEGADSVVPFKSGPDTSDATALASHITVGQTAYVNGVKITGTRPVPVTRQSGSGSRRIESAISADVIINFNSAFDNAPKVSFSITKGIADSQHEVTAHGSYSIVSRDRTHFVVRIKNNDTLQGVTYSYSWTAEG